MNHNYPKALVCTRPPLSNEIPAKYEQYHYESMEIGDIHPNYQMLRYICDRFDLTTEQRYWIAFLYATCYCGATTYYMFHEFPDFESVNIERLSRWWDANKQRLMFLSDRRWIRSKNKFYDVFLSYRRRVGRLTQEQLFRSFQTPDLRYTYDRAWDELGGVYQFGRLTMPIYLEAIHTVTGYHMRPAGINLALADNCRNAVALAIGRPELNTYQSERKLSHSETVYLQGQFNNLVATMERDDERNNVWNIVTTLCAYKKYRYGKRWVGYYLDRQAGEIETMQSAITEGVNWRPLWEYRKETYRKKYLKELR